MDSKEIDEGYIKGETCNRNGCNGIIQEYHTDTCCSCHLNPPCSHCTTQTEFCPECSWTPADDEVPYVMSEADEAYYKKQREEFAARRDSFWRKYRGSEPIEKLEFWHQTHTHFTQKWFGVFPEGTETTASILPQVVGTFGGRFDKFDKNSFEYTAYTD